MTKPNLISGIQPTGKLHIGNYLGALKNFVDLQNSGKYSCYFFIADYHSMTEPFEPKEKQKQILDIAFSYLAAGLDPKKSVIFQQSAISAHTDLAWILNTITPMGELRRMTQFKDKSDYSIKCELEFDDNVKCIAEKTEKKYQASPESANTGLFTYPTLMASDILLYDAKFVPVGDDQLQHLELTRTLARKFNNRFGKTFIEPQPILTPVSRLMSLNDPKKKMSKSLPEGCLFMEDEPETIRKKIMRAVTDSGNEVKAEIEGKEGIGNLIILRSAITGESGTVIEKKFAGKQYGEFKKELADIVVKFLTPYQERKKKLVKNKTIVKTVLNAGNKKAKLISDKKLIAIKKKLGLLI
jgi:tryptophanyl-tRNA synthetase